VHGPIQDDDYNEGYDSLQGCTRRIMEFLSQKIHIIFAVMFAAVLSQVSLLLQSSIYTNYIGVFIHTNEFTVYRLSQFRQDRVRCKEIAK